MLAVILIVGCLSVSVSAKGNIIVMGETRTKELHNASATYHKQAAESALSQYVDVPILMSKIMSGISNCEEAIDISAYSIPISIFDYISDYVFYGLPEAFNVAGVNCSYYEQQKAILSLRFTYNTFADTPDEYAACISEINSATNVILSGIKGNDMLNDEQKLLLIHDRLAAWNSYGYPEGTTQIEAHTVYGALGNKMSVCQGYAMAYMYLLNKVNIESYYCSSRSMVHGWNIVFVDGAKYHVDVTWDDVYGFSGVSHDNFLRSSNGIYATGHDGTDYDTSPNNTKYDNYFWQNYHVEFQLANNEIYYADNESQHIRRYSDKEAIHSIEASWKGWYGNFSYLASDGRSLFYSQPDAIYRLDLTTNKTEKIYAPTMSAGESIFMFGYQDETLLCYVGDTPNDDNAKLLKQPYKYDYNAGGGNEDSELPSVGDVSGDLKINNKDLAFLMQYINGWNVTIDVSAADVNKDDKVNNKDYALLMQYINGWDVKLD